MASGKKGDSSRSGFEGFGDFVEERIPEFVAKWGTVGPVEGWASGLYCSKFGEFKPQVGICS